MVIGLMEDLTRRSRSFNLFPVHKEILLKGFDKFGLMNLDACFIEGEGAPGKTSNIVITCNCKRSLRSGEMG